MSDIDMLTAAVSSDPADKTAYNALYDALQEVGHKPLTARRKANSVQRAAKDRQMVADAQSLVVKPGKKGGRLRRAIRGSRNPAVIVVEAGDSPARVSGEGSFHTFKHGSHRVTNVGWAIKNGYRITFHPSTLTVHVGAEEVFAIIHALDL